MDQTFLRSKGISAAFGDVSSGGADYGEIPAAGRTGNVFRVTCTYCDNSYVGETGSLKEHTRSLWLSNQPRPSVAEHD